MCRERFEVGNWVGEDRYCSETIGGPDAAKETSNPGMGSERPFLQVHSSLLLPLSMTFYPTQNHIDEMIHVYGKRTSRFMAHEQSLAAVMRG